MVATSKTKIIDDLFNTDIYSCRIQLCKLVSILFYDELSSIQSQTYSSFTLQQYFPSSGQLRTDSIFCIFLYGFIFLLYNITVHYQSSSRSSHPDSFLGKGVLEICCNLAGENPCRSVISIKLLCNFIKITLRHGCSHLNLLHIFRTPFHKNTFEWLLLKQGIIPCYAFQAFLLFSSTTNLVCSSHWEKKLVLPDFMCPIMT